MIKIVIMRKIQKGTVGAPETGSKPTAKLDPHKSALRVRVHHSTTSADVLG